MTAPSFRASGRIRTVRIGGTPADGGSRGEAVEVGGETCLPFHRFEGEMPLRPVVAWEIPDSTPVDWCETLREPYAGVFDDPVAWARFAVERGARLLCLDLRGAAADKGNRSAAESADLLRRLLGAVKVPLIVKGPGPGERQNEVLTACAEAAQGERLLLASAVEEEYKTLVAAGVAFGHAVTAETPIDVNLCKQLNILMTDLHFPPDSIVIDPLTGGLGYGLEYTYSVMERIRLQALGGDEMLQMPFICFVGAESWKVKEVKVPEEREPSWGDRARRGVLWEITTAVSLLHAGAAVLVMRHPAAIAAVEKAIDGLMEGTEPQRAQRTLRMG
ncbi:MAG: acetyl-CoA decarbonylase/synthase complex subunit delta [bacterium]|nr:acetyl-CoA decarbonylase/synthase complex subunit delta [bacterium]